MRSHVISSTKTSAVTVITETRDGSIGVEIEAKDVLNPDGPVSRAASYLSRDEAVRLIALLTRAVEGN